IRVLDDLAVADQLVAPEPLHLGSDADGEAARVEPCDRSAAAAAREQRVPGGCDIVAHRRDESDAGDRDAPAPACARRAHERLGMVERAASATTSRRAVA